jgi:protein-S-isoprenylcysteine O-methyltransferase Ste14
MKKALFFTYGSVVYVMFLGVFAYAAGFLGNLFVPKSIDSGPAVPLAQALAVNLLLLGAFAVQHSAMARPAFKRWWTRIVPDPIERSTYVLLSNLALILLFWQWRPMSQIVWDVQNVVGRGCLFALYGLGWVIVVSATFQLNHFDLFGLRQVWLYLRGKEYTRLIFKTPLYYRYARHPLYIGWLTAFWATPTMTAGHLLFAAVTTLYILVAIQLEERNLVEIHGEQYVEYRKLVPMLLPIPRLTRGAASTAEAAA